MRFFLIIVGGLALILFISVDLYIAGRIVLPDMGLKALQFQTCFWFSFWSLIISSPLILLREVLKD